MRKIEGKRERLLSLRMCVEAFFEEDFKSADVDLKVYPDIFYSSFNIIQDYYLEANVICII